MVNIRALFCGRCGKRFYEQGGWYNFCEECRIERKEKTTGGLCGEHRCFHCGERFYKTQSWIWDNSNNL